MKYAVDLPHHQQFFAKYRNQKEKWQFLKLMKQYGYTACKRVWSRDYDFPILVVNFLQGNIHGIGAAAMACACTCGAKQLAIEQFLNEIHYENLHLTPINNPDRDKYLYKKPRKRLPKKNQQERKQEVSWPKRP